MATLKIMSFNMRMSHANDGVNNFVNRKPRILEMLTSEDPDIIGFQEITPEMRDFIIENLADYYAVGAGRGATYNDEAPLIAFKKLDMQLISCDTVMLSTTPSVPGSVYEGSDQSRCPRAYAKAFLKHKDIDKPFYVYNVHTDHVGALSRTLASLQMLQDITSHNREFLLTGDFNAHPDSREIKMITDCRSRRIIDATASLDGTFHDYGRRENNVKIDYIFASDGVNVIDSNIVSDEPVNGVYYSDHFAVTATVEL